MDNRTFAEFDDAFEIVEHPKAKNGEYAVRFRRDPYAGTVIQFTSFVMKETDQEDIMEMTFQYDVLESSIPADTLELEPDFTKLVANVMLNMQERIAVIEELQPVETVVREDGGTEITFDISDNLPHGEVVSD